MLSASPLRFRVQSVDALRGLVMIIMALDHVREFFHAGAMVFQAEDLTRTTIPLFFTRWITHFCAPVFMFTAGLAMFFWLGRGRTRKEASAFLWKRGIWLVLLDLTVIRFALNFGFTSGFLILNVLWALGWSMVALSLLIHLPIRILTALSVSLIALHNLADPITASQFGKAGWIWNILHQPGVFQAAGVPVLAAYPLIPWIAVMSAGFCFGRVMTLNDVERRRRLFQIGLGLTVAFLVIRGINSYGDPQPWSFEAPGAVLLSFLRTTKYPPSLDFLLMTLGPSILLLSWLERLRFSSMNPLIVFGRTPLFFFVAHLFVAHAASIPLALIRYGEASFVRNVLPSLGGDAKLYPPGYGYELPFVYLIWAAVVILLYPACLWFSRIKERRRYAWLSYL